MAVAKTKKKQSMSKVYNKTFETLDELDCVAFFEKVLVPSRFGAEEFSKERVHEFIDKSISKLVKLDKEIDNL